MNIVDRHPTPLNIDIIYLALLFPLLGRERIFVQRIPIYHLVVLVSCIEPSRYQDRACDRQYDRDSHKHRLDVHGRRLAFQIKIKLFSPATELCVGVRSGRV